MMKIVEILFVTDKQTEELKELFSELSPGLQVSSQMLVRASEAKDTHLFAMLDDEGRIIGSATLCVNDLPTGRKASVEAVVVRHTYRGKHFGRMLMEYVIDYVRINLGDVIINLTSHPKREAANALYKSLGFRQRETNVYQFEIRH